MGASALHAIACLTIDVSKDSIDAVSSNHTLEAIGERIAQISSQDNYRLDSLLGCMAKLRDSDRELCDFVIMLGPLFVKWLLKSVDRPTRVDKSLNRIHDQLLLCIRNELSRITGNERLCQQVFRVGSAVVRRKRRGD